MTGEGDGHKHAVHTSHKLTILEAAIVTALEVCHSDLPSRKQLLLRVVVRSFPPVNFGIHRSGHAETLLFLGCSQLKTQQR